MRNKAASARITEHDAPTPILFTVFWNSLTSIVDQMGVALQRTAYSDIVREALDFSTALLDHKGRLIAQGMHLPGMLGCMPEATKAAIAKFPLSDLHEGDAILLNLSELNAGHLPDWTLITPVFAAGSIIGFAVNCAHHLDIGGSSPGSMRVHGISDAYQEGLRIPPVSTAA